MPEQIQKVLDILAALATSPIGQVVLGVIAFSVLFVVFALVKAALSYLEKQAAKTPTKVDDELVEGAEKAVDEAEKGARAFLRKVFRL